MSEIELGCPVAFQKIELSQGRNGRYSHKNWGWGKPEMINAIDIMVPIGTAVLAMTDGQIIAVFDRSNEYYVGKDLNIGLKSWKTNFVAILHENGIQTFYAHLMEGSVNSLLSEGTSVKKGQKIGISGLSGWLGWDRLVPHVHVQVNKSNLLGGINSLPFKIEGYSGPYEDKDLSV